MVKTSRAPQISIVIPLFNSEEFIETCIDSILQQTFEDFEVIVVDDCSTDRSLEIIERYKDSRIRIFRNLKNLRCDITRNVGLSIAKGKYVYFMDSDDAILSQTLEVLFKTMEESQAEVVCMNSRYAKFGGSFDITSQIKVDKQICFNPQPRFLSSNILERLILEYFERGIFWEPWTRIQRRDFLLESKIRFPDTKRAGDRLFHFAELCNAKKFQVIDFCGYIYNNHNEQTTSKSSEELLKINITLIPPAIKFIRELLESKNLLENLPSDTRCLLEINAMLDYFGLTVAEIYRRELDQSRINEILLQSMSKSEMHDPEFLVAMTNMLAKYIIANGRSIVRNVSN